MAHKCLYCNNEIAPDEVLFILERTDGVGKTPEKKASKPAKPVPSKKTGAYDSWDDEPVESESASLEEETRDVNEDYIGCWHDDDIYVEHYRDFMYMDVEKVIRKRRIFAVRWHGGAAEKGKAYGKAENGRLPKFVDLSDEDQKNSGFGVDRINTAICPHCHANIPAGFFEAREEDVERVCMVGGSRAGKTQYILAFYQNARQYLGSDTYQLAHITFEPVAERVFEYLSEQLEKTGKIETTKLDKPNLPVVFALEPRLDPIHYGHKRFVVLYDVPGEIFKEENIAHMLSAKGLRNSTSAMVLFDPAQTFTVMWNYYNGIDEDPEVCRLEAYDMLNNLRANQGSDRPYRRVAMTITKIDTLWNTPQAGEGHFSPNVGETVRGMHPNVFIADDSDVHRGAVDMSVIDDNSVHWESTLKDRNVSCCIDLSQKVRAAFNGLDEAHCKVFAVSTWRKDGPESGFTNALRADPMRFRVMEPMLYLLADMGFIRKKYIVREYVKTGWLRRRLEEVDREVIEGPED